jgi:broad specificity phosphatase PhoE
MNTRIIMIRHGYSVANKEKYFTGQTDISLTDTGRDQARLCGEFFKVWQPCSACGEERTERIWDMGIGQIDAVYSSDLERAYETSLPVARALGLESVKSEGLREINGGAWERMPFVEIDEKYSDQYEIWKNDIGRAECVGGERVADFAKRIIREVTEIAQRHSCGCVVLVTHATPIRVISTLAEGLDPLDMARVPWVSNASISIFDFDGSFKSVRTNITSHLGQLKTDLPRGV